MTPSSFKIYNASAGSGKTFTLVKEYLKILLKSNKKEAFKHILAITFTNKAVGEMKERIIETLKQFASTDVLKTQNSMFDVIVEELQIEPIVLHNKSKIILSSIINNYAAFDISTIDGFTHRIIRTFAYDLKLPLNFEVELDQDALLNEAVDSLISKAGNDKALTKVLVDFAIEKADDDKSWDVSFDFNKIAKLLVRENDAFGIESLKNKTIDDFKILKIDLIKKILTIEDAVVVKAQGILTLIDECGLQFDDFSRSSLPKHFENLVNKKFEIKFDLNWQTSLVNGETLYPKRVTEDIESIINDIQSQLILAFTETKKDVFQLKFLKAFYKYLTPLSVLNAIQNELDLLKTEQNKMLISEFNTIISNQIKNQPTPFIYERLGEKFNHYFIDEFQDTSVLQWENLIPLLDNSLSTENGSVMLVGDAKQAIYRWRGGKAEQFIDLYNNKSLPFQIEQEEFSLKTNYRSFKEIINFNNSFFEYLSNTIFSSDMHQQLYKTATQNHALDYDGFVSLTFLDIDKNDDKDQVYAEKVFEAINDCIKNGFKLQDICVLVRKKKEGIAIANYLSENGIKIMSSETLLIHQSPEVTFVNNVLKLIIHPKNSEIKVEVLNYLAEKYKVQDKHDFFQKHIALGLSQLFESFKSFDIHLNNSNLLEYSLYDLAETIVQKFNLVKTSNAYVQFYLDVVLEYSQKKGSDLLGFIDYFEKKKESLSIVSPKDQNAVQIMTIHKSKGLEFPVVIFPYADLDIYRELEPKEWFPLNKEDYNGFSHTLLNYNKDFKNYGETGKRIYENHQAELELDNINLLYVALTRSIEQLYIISKKDISSKGVVNPKTYAGLLIQYLQSTNLWNDAQLDYTFGNPIKLFQNYIASKSTIEQDEFISTSKEIHNIKIVVSSGYLWDTSQQDAIEKGNLIHNIMSHIYTKNDIDFVLNDFLSDSVIDQQQATELKLKVTQIVNHIQLKDYFNSEYIIYNERDIISKNGIILRPDRLVINSNNEVTIIDYKTGVEDKKHKQQLQLYQDLLEEMELKVISKILIYINDDIIIKEV